MKTKKELMEIAKRILEGDYSALFSEEELQELENSTRKIRALSESLNAIQSLESSQNSAVMTEENKLIEELTR